MNVSSIFEIHFLMTLLGLTLIFFISSSIVSNALIFHTASDSAIDYFLFLRVLLVFIVN